MPRGMGGLRRIQNAYKEPLDLWFSGNHLGEPTGDTSLPPPRGAVSRRGGCNSLEKEGSTPSSRNRESPRRGASGSNPRD